MQKKSDIGLGTSAIGRPVYINIKTETKTLPTLEAFKQNSIAVLDHAYNKGIRYFDTAPGYGIAEELLIDWVKNKNDNAVEIASKWGYSYVANFNANATEHEVKDHSIAKLNEQWEVSKQLLPHLKYYQIHSATFETGVLTNVAILDRLYELKTQHNIKVGITSTGYNQVEVLRKAMGIQYNGEALFEVFQCTYNILDQSILEIGKEIIQQKKQLVLKETLANGRLFPNINYKKYKPLYDELQGIAEKYEVGIDAIVIRFCMQTLKGSMTLSGANKTDYIAENLKANAIELMTEEIEGLKKYKVNPKAYWEERRRLQWN